MRHRPVRRGDARRGGLTKLGREARNRRRARRPRWGALVPVALRAILGAVPLRRADRRRRRVRRRGRGFRRPHNVRSTRMTSSTRFPADLQIARKAKLKPLIDVAAEMGIGSHLLEPYGGAVAKVKLEAIEGLEDRPPAKYVVVSAVTPTPLGEGKTTTTVGLGQAFSHIGKQATVAVRQPSMGPTFGIKGGAAGGGYSQVVPMEMLNLHLTGDMPAVTAAHNMLAAMIDNHLHRRSSVDLDPHSVTWRRVLDVNDRSLRNVVIGLGSKEDGTARESGFDITAASEVMAVLALSTSLHDMRSRLG